MPENNLSAESHFFTNPSLISQTAQQAFGPQSAEVYNISSKFTVSADSMAFAICKSVVLVQPATGSADKVNLILRPYTQPLAGINIKYFIYRGLKKSDFFNGNEVLGSGSGFITKIRNDFQNFYATDPVNTNPPFLAKYIGFDPENQPDTLLLDNFFFKESEYVESNGEFQENPSAFGNFELPLVDIGTSLGHFAQGECAIDVVLNYGDYKPTGELSEHLLDIAYARSSGEKITVSSENTYEDKLKKEQIFQFLDIAAFYGWFTTNGTVTVDNSGTKQKYTGQEIYGNILSGFSTKNKLYLYIQGDRTRSYNFYNNYKIGDTANSLKWGTVAETLIEKQYATQGWPVIIESPATESVYIQFVTDNNVNTILYGQIANIKDTKNNFANADDLLLPADENGVLGKFTKVLELKNPIVGENGPVIANFNMLIYQGVSYSYEARETIDENNNTVPLYAQPNFFDDVFDLITAEPLLNGANADDYTVISSQRVKLINEYYDRKQQGISAVQTLVVRDSIETGDEANPYLKRVAYITETIDVYNNATSVINKTSSSTLSSSGAGGSVNPGKMYNLPKPYYYTLQKFTDNLETIRGILLNSFEESIPNKIIVGVTEEEHELIKNITGTNNLQSVRLFLIDLFDIDNQLVSSDGIKYSKYKLAVVGENTDAMTKLYHPENDITIYSLDRRYHFSKDYGMFMPEPEYKIETRIVNTVE